MGLFSGEWEGSLFKERYVKGVPISEI